ncbi:MAG: beta-L-arabinofuranosidase domain-containing protein [Thermoguttaceae bacterium]
MKSHSSMAKCVLPVAGVLALLIGPIAISSGAGRLDNAPKAAVADKIQDKFVPAAYDQQTIEGLLGQRMKINLHERLLRLDLAPLLAGFQKRPGVQDWIGEHAGKFLHAAANTWAYTGDEALKTRMDYVAKGLVAAQLPDGYLGTYVESKRWTSWDVWVHKYDLIGLLAYYGVTGDRPALDACRKIGDLLCRTFGDGPGQRDLMTSGTHVGMAPGSVLEPMCMLYRMTGDKRYLDFCYYITRAYDGPRGPKVITTLTETGSVVRTANGKAYEMLSNLVGLADLYRLTGDEKFLTPAVNAWKDITAHRLYVTGTSSHREHFRGDDDLPASGAVGENCVTVTWMQLNWQLLRLTGQAQYADELERSVYNALLGSQQPASGQLCYFTPLVGKKPYGVGDAGAKGVNCCISSGQRGLSLIPQMAWGTLDGAPAIMFYTPGRFTTTVNVGGKPVKVEIQVETQFPADGRLVVSVKADSKESLTTSLKSNWARLWLCRAGGRPIRRMWPLSAGRRFLPSIAP